jgi:hypothetical protein
VKTLFSSQLLGKPNPWLLSGWSGILFVVVSIISALALGQSPSYEDEGEVIVAWYSKNYSRYLATHFVAGLAFLLFYIPFLAGLVERLREAEGTYAIWSRVAFTGGILFPAVGTARGLFATGPALLAGNVSPEVASFAAAAGAYGLIVTSAMGGILVGGSAVVILTTRVFWAWLGWLGAAVAILTIVSVAAIVERRPDGVFSLLNSIAFEGIFLWILAVSVALLRSGRGRHFAEEG